MSALSIACATLLAACATNDQGQLVVDPNKVNEVLAGVLNPPPPAPPETDEEAYQPMPNDSYVSAVADADVVIVGGDTYIWVAGPDGIRHRRFYAHGDHRQDVFHRREELHRVMVNHAGHLPDHAIAAHGPIERPGAPGHAGPLAQNHPAPAVRPVAHATAQNRPAPAAKPAPKDPKKS